MAGAYGVLYMCGPNRPDSRLEASERTEWMDHFNYLDALNVAMVARYLMRESGWTRRQVDVALDDLANDESIRLVAESETGDIGIELLRRPEDAP